MAMGYKAQCELEILIWNIANWGGSYNEVCVHSLVYTSSSSSASHMMSVQSDAATLAGNASHVSVTPFNGQILVNVWE